MGLIHRQLFTLRFDFLVVRIESATRNCKLGNMKNELQKGQTKES